MCNNNTLLLLWDMTSTVSEKHTNHPKEVLSSGPEISETLAQDKKTKKVERTSYEYYGVVHHLGCEDDDVTPKKNVE